MTPVSEEPHPASFRDPAGYVFRRDGVVYRRVLPEGHAEYRRLMGGGLYAAATSEGLLLPHEEIGGGLLRPEQLPFVSYPYEWSFGQWRDAALVTLALQSRALDFGMSLKDASAFNIQFSGGKPLTIDTLSFETYREGEPWVAYRQFCEHFLAPLALMAYTDIRLGSLFRSYLDGIPLSLAAKLLPLSARLNLSLLAHIFVQSGFQEAGESTGFHRAPAPMPLLNLRALLDNLQTAVKSLRWEPTGTVWADYYEGGTNYSGAAMTAKETLVAQYLDEIAPLTSVWDIGANDARFSRLASGRGVPTVAFDIDPAAVERAYRDVRRNNETHLLPLLTDLTNPSPDQGWAHAERMSLAARGPADAVIALALVHHLAIGNNVPLPRISAYFAQLARRFLLIEFVPKEDSQTARLLRSRRDIFPAYTQAGFEAAFGADFETVRVDAIPGTVRTLYLFRNGVK